MWVKKYVEIREILFKNLKLLFGNTHQIPPKCWKNICLYRIQNIRSGDNMYYVSFRIQEQESVPWCSEIQNKRLEVLGITFNFHSNST